MFKFRFPQLSLLFLFTALAAFWTLSQNEGEFTHKEMEFYSLYVLAALALQMACLSALIWAKSLSKVFGYGSKALAAIFTSFNAYTLIIVHNARFSGLEEPYWTLFIIALVCASAIPFFVTNKIFIKFLHIFCFISLGMNLVDFSSDYKDIIRDRMHRLPNTFTAVDFKKKPNIYLISFDAMVPEPIAKNIIGVDKISYAQTIKDMNFRLIPNSFAEPIPTQFSLNAVLAMDLDYFEKIDNKRAFIRSSVATPGYELFRHNGYKIQFMYQTSYFGEGTGNIDYYGIASKKGLCQHVEKKYSFMGFCSAPVRGYLETFIDMEDHPYPEMLFERIKETAAMEGPWLTYAYIYEPGHAKNSFNPYKKEDWEEYRKKFPSYAKKAQRSLEALIATIKDHDSNAILFVFGDHGAMTSKGLLDDAKSILPDAREFDAAKLSPKSPLSFEQIVQDRHAVLNAIYPAEACHEHFKQNPFSTVRLLRELAKCLSGDQDPLPKNFQANDESWRPYLYE